MRTKAEILRERVKAMRKDREEKAAQRRKNLADLRMMRVNYPVSFQVFVDLYPELVADI